MAESLISFESMNLLTGEWAAHWDALVGWPRQEEHRAQRAVDINRRDVGRSASQVVIVSISNKQFQPKIF